MPSIRALQFFSAALSIAGVLVGAATALAQQYPHVVAEEPLSPEEQLEKFHLPEGFTIELVAAEPQIAKPINLNFDAHGRLLLTQSVEYPMPVAGGHGRDKVQVLADRDGDGRYETVAAAVDGLNIPIGVTPVDSGDIVVFSVPNIYRASDADGDGRYEQLKRLYGPFGFDDTHGLNNGFTRWLDGWIYACHGFRNTSSVSGADGRQVTMNSGNTYRFRADGSRIEQLTWGQVNPFGLTFDPLGNIYTADCHSKPMYQLLRGAYYPSFGKPDDGLGFGPTLIEHSHGSTGIGGIVYYAAEQFPPQYRDVIFVGNPITHRVNCDRLERHGSTYRGFEMPDFLVCDDPWFRPVDLQLGPDGALYVADFYNRIIGHYEVPLDHPGRDRHRGRIWRITYTGKENDKTADKDSAGAVAKSSDLTTLELAQLWKRLTDTNFTVRTLATHQIVDRFGDEAKRRVPKWMISDSAATQRAHGLWICSRLSVLDDALIRRLAEDEAALVRVHLMKALAERANWGDGESPLAGLVRDALGDDDAFVRRAAADALARHPLLENVAPLLDLWDRTPADDTHLVHVVRMSLRDQLRALKPYDALAARLRERPDDRARLLDVSLGVRDAASAEFVLAGLQEAKLDIPRRDALVHYALLHLDAKRLPAAVDVLLAAKSKPQQQQVELLETAARACQERGVPLPEKLRGWAVSLAGKLLAADETSENPLGVRLAGGLRLSESFDRLRQIALDGKSAVQLRSDAAEACVAARPAESVGPLAELLAGINQPAALRTRAAKALSGVNRDEAREALAAQLPAAHYRLAVEIAAGLARSSPGAKLLLKAVKAGKATPRLLLEREVQVALRGSGLADWEPRIKELTAGVAPLDQQLDRLVAQRRAEFLKVKPDLAAGAAAFKKTCAACHRIGEVGNKIGPELDGIGNRGLDRVLEDVLDPNRTVDPAFRSTIVQTTGGQLVTGLALREEGKVLVLVDGEGKERRVPLDEIDVRQTSPLSPMPANVTELVKGDDFLHLVAYLLAQRQQEKK